MKILNSYAGIGGNRKLWGNDHEITAVELDPQIAKIYSDLFPNDKVIVADAHQYLLDHFQEFDFIWSSPPCPSHSRMRNIKNNAEECKKIYPDMKLYEEIIFLKHFAKCKWVVENVISYYEPLIQPYIYREHYYWANFPIFGEQNESRQIREDKYALREKTGFNLENYKIKIGERKALRNCVLPECGAYILECAFKKKQTTLE